MTPVQSGDDPSDPPRQRKRMGRPTLKDREGGADASTRLLQAATAEFVERGYDGTSTNRIAERAGFAPQTFYRWYSDKLAVFVAVHEAWAEAEMAQLEALLSEPEADSPYLAEVCVESHRSFRVFQRSLERLAQDVPAVRQARAQARLGRIGRVRGMRPDLSLETVATLLVTLDHLCNALAEGEFADLGLEGREALLQVAAIVEQLRSR